MESLPFLAKFPRWAPWLKHNARRNRGAAFFHAVAQEADEQSPHNHFSRELLRDYQQAFNLTKPEGASPSFRYEADERRTPAQSPTLPATCALTLSLVFVPM